MENKNTTLIIILTFIVGILLGVIFGGPNWMGSMMFQGNMYEEMEEHMYGDEIIDHDGAMIHAMDEMMRAFRGKEGDEYDEIFLRSMIVHHLGAIQISEELLENTDRQELQTFAQDIISTQSAEVEEMKGWLDAWFNDAN